MKKINGYDHYYITKDGRVYSTLNNKFLYTWTDNTGYSQVALFKEGKKKHFRIHRLVAEGFVLNTKGKPFVNHIDGNKLNNHYSNLEWVTNSENTQHAYDNNLYKNTNRCEVDVFSLDGDFLQSFPSIRSLAKELNVNRKTVTSILKHKKRNNYNYIFKYK